MEGVGAALCFQQLADGYRSRVLSEVKGSFPCLPISSPFFSCPKEGELQPGQGRWESELTASRAPSGCPHLFLIL